MARSARKVDRPSAPAPTPAQAESDPGLAARSKPDRIIESFMKIMVESRRQSQQWRELAGVTGPQMNALTLLFEHGAMTHTALAEGLYLSASTVSGIVDRLEREGYVTRTRQQGDRRVVEIELDVRGRAVAEKWQYRILGDVKQHLDELPQPELDSFLRTLTKVQGMMEAARAQT